MNRIERSEIDVERERCFLVGLLVPGRYSPHEDPLEELGALVDTAGGVVVGKLTQRLDHPHGRTYLGKGKLEELVALLAERQAETVVVDDDLTPSQLATLEECCGRKVIDRTEVILDIFASRARTYQAKLQVELAQLQYALPRLKRKWLHLERLGGGIGTRGPGESQIESDRRILRRRIAHLRAELDEIEERKRREVLTRASCFTVCLVGYTNAGKSSLFNRLTDADTLVEDRLFATLDTLTRRMTFPDGTTALLSDTVGFIRRLPHHLVASFHATLEEAAQADFLLHVVDASHPLAREQLAAANAILKEIGLENRPRLHLLNKCDLITDRGMIETLRTVAEPSLLVSAKTGEGLDTLRSILHRHALEGHRIVTLRFSAADGRRFALVNAVGKVQNLRYEEGDVIVTVALSAADLERIRRLPGECTLFTA